MLLCSSVSTSSGPSVVLVRIFWELKVFRSDLNRLRALTKYMYFCLGAMVSELNSNRFHALK